MASADFYVSRVSYSYEYGMWHDEGSDAALTEELVRLRVSETMAMMRPKTDSIRIQLK